MQRVGSNNDEIQGTILFFFSKLATSTYFLLSSIPINIKKYQSRGKLDILSGRIAICKGPAYSGFYPRRRFVGFDNALKEISPPPSSVAAIVCCALSATNDFRQVEFIHTWRLRNKLAHLLAKHVQGITNFSVWLEENPCFIEQTLLYNVTLISQY